MQIPPMGFGDKGLLTYLVIVSLLLACAPADPPPVDTNEGDARDYTQIQRERAERMEAVVDEFKRTQGDDLLATAGEVIARHLEAVGGPEAFDTINTMVMRLSTHGAMGRYAEIVRYYKRPLHYRQQSVGGDYAAVTDGRRFWRVSSQGWEEVEETAYFRLASIDGYLVEYADWGVSYELQDVMALDSDPGYAVKRLWPDGSDELLFFSATSGLLTAVQSAYMILPESWRSYWNYRDIGGLRLPQVSIRSIGELGPPHGSIVESVEINVALPDSLFLPPGER